MFYRLWYSKLVRVAKNYPVFAKDLLREKGKAEALKSRDQNPIDYVMGREVYHDVHDRPLDPRTSRKAINIMINGMTLPMQALFLPESPYYLFVKGPKKEFYASILTLGQIFAKVSRQEESPVDITALALSEPDFSKDGSGLNLESGFKPSKSGHQEGGLLLEGDAR